MNAPLFEKLTFHKVDTYHIKEICLKAEIGSYPVYTELSTLPAKQFLENLEIVLKELSIHPFFPYPIYIITDQIKCHPTFPILKSLRELPRFFYQKSISANKNKLSKKNQAIYYKLRSTNIYHKHQLIKNFATEHHIIYHNSDEINFYKKILDNYRGHHD